MIVTAPAAFAFTYDSSPERHDHGRAARVGRAGRSKTCHARSRRSDARALGYSEDDIPELVEGALAQQRLLAVAPREVDGDDLAAILRESLHS